jgi:hypothetical protein
MKVIYLIVFIAVCYLLATDPSEKKPVQEVKPAHTPTKGKGK